MPLLNIACVELILAAGFAQLRLPRKFSSPTPDPSPKA